MSGDVAVQWEYTQVRGIDTSICKAFEITAGDRLTDVNLPVDWVILHILLVLAGLFSEFCKVPLHQQKDRGV